MQICSDAEALCTVTIPVINILPVFSIIILLIA